MNGEKEPESRGLVEFLSSAWRHGWLFGLFLVAATLIGYGPAWHAGLIWDDDRHITPPALRSPNGLARIWTQPGATQQYYPLVHSAFWVEYRLWGDATAGYHWVNILLHAFSALLLVKILRQLKIPGAWLAAALFALHPVEVESVAWISELKNTLSGVFYLSAALAYLGFDQNRNRGNYAAALGLFLLGLMSKTVIASLPAALLVVFWWQRGKLSWKRDVLPLIPFFIAGIGAGLFTAWVERRFIHAEGTEFNLSIIERFLIAGRAIWFYLGKLFWPVDLALIYPRWNVSQTVWWQYLFPAAAMLLLGVLVWRRWRGPLAGLLFFVGTLFPALGFFNVYPFRYSFVADHFQYLASLGPLTLVAVGITALPGLFRKRKPFLEPMLCATLLLVLATLTWNQCGMYANFDTVWLKTLRLNPDCWMAHNNLGLALLYKGGQADEAIAHFQKALEINPADAEACYNLGIALQQKGRVEEAMAHYQKALAMQPRMAGAHVNLGDALMQKGEVDKAIAQFQEALAISPRFAMVHGSLGIALAKKGQLTEAIAQFQKSLETDPDNEEVRKNLAMAFAQKGQPEQAIAQFDRVLEINPDSVEACDNLAWLLATASDSSLRDGAKAIALAQHAGKLADHDNPFILRTLAAAYAETGNYREAITTARRALEFAARRKNDLLAGKLQQEIKLYEAASPVRGTFSR
jgi:tetratricopeptide (TPR) repeat protein